MDYYEILGVPRSASAPEIERGFRSVARRVHPDLNLGDGNADARMKQLNHIRDTLVDPLLRAAYDDRLPQEGAAPPKAAARAHSDGDGSTGRGRASRFEASRAAPPGAWGTPDGRPGGAAPAAWESTPNRSAPVLTRHRWLAAMALVLLPVAGVLGVRSARRRRTTSPSPATTPMPIEPPPRPPALAADEPKYTAAKSPRGSAPRTIASTAPTVSMVVPPRRGTERRSGVVRIGSTSDQVRRAFGPPDRIEPGPRPGDATMIYGDLRLDFRKGRVIAGATPGGARVPAVPAHEP